MKLGVAAIVIIALVACSGALPAKKRMVYYQQPAQFYGAPQRMMYLQYVQPAQTHARSTQGAEVLVAGDTVATGTYLKDCDTAEGAVAAESNGEDALAAAGAHGAQSVAEAYPAESANPEVQVEADEPAVDAESQVQSDDEAKVPRDYNFENAAAAADAAAPAANEPVAAEEPAVTADVPAPAPAVAAAPAEPAKRYLPAKKKVFVELEQPAADESGAEEETDNAAAVADEETAAAAEAEDDEQDEEEAPAAPVVAKTPARRPLLRKPAKPVKENEKPTKPVKPLPAGTFFPIDFGGTNGGAIAIANSFSTGEGGSATSHAIAYGSPDAARARARPSKYH